MFIFSHKICDKLKKMFLIHAERVAIFVAYPMIFIKC